MNDIKCKKRQKEMNDTKDIYDINYTYDMEDINEMYNTDKLTFCSRGKQVLAVVKTMLKMFFFCYNVSDLILFRP